MKHKATSKESYPRLWRIKRFWRKLKHNIVSFAHWIVKAKPVALTLPWVTGSYYLILDIWGDKWEIIKNHLPFHEKVFCISLFLSLIALFIRGLLKKRPGLLEADECAKEVLADFITTIGTIVKSKNDRFKEQLASIKKKSNKFSKITHPKKQLKVIASATSNFLQKSYGLKDDEISINILFRKEKKWSYIYTHQDWNHTEANKLVEECLGIIHCIETGEPLFLPDKIKGAKEKKFHLSRRDKRRGDGSAYLYPLNHKTATGPVDYMISIVTYSKQLCEHYEKQTVEITQSFLREFVRRLEIELCLHTIEGI